MKSATSCFLIILFSVSITRTGAQEPVPEREAELIIESVTEKLEEGADASMVAEDLQELSENPLNLNEATEDDFRKLYFLDPVQITNLIEYRKRYGQIYSLSELIAIDGFSGEVIQKLTPFVKAGPSGVQAVNLKEAFSHNDHQLFIRTTRNIQKAEGYKAAEEGTTAFEGDPGRYYLRYRLENSRLTAGFISEKDPGEAFFRQSNKAGFDFYNFYADLKVNKLVEQIIAGDYVIRSGQGLVTWQGYSPGKSVDVLNVSKTGQGIRPNTSGDENRFFRGIAASLNLDKVELQLFLSSKREDANREGNDSTGYYFTSLQTSGYHRTLSETGDEKSVAHTHAGALAAVNLKNMRIGATFLFEKFEYPFSRTPQLYNFFYFEGTENLNFSIDYQYYFKRLHFFGEAARSKSGGLAFVQGLVAHPDDRAGFSFLFRHFGKNHQSTWGNAFSEATAVAGETGFYAGARIFPVKKVTLSAYSDFYRFTWITFSTMAPSSGFDFQVQADFKPSSGTLLYLRFKNEEKEMKTLFEGRYTDIPEKLQRYRFHAEYQLFHVLRLRNRFEVSAYRGKTTESGYLVFQDVIYSPGKVPFSAAFRAAWFHTGSFSSAIYAYENDVLYSFSIPAYFGEGFRFYLNLKYRMVRNLDLWLRIGHTLYNDLESIGSGYDRIDGNMKTDIKFQLRLGI